MCKIIHIDTDAFFAAVEQRNNPELRGKPVAVGSNSDRGVVSTASCEVCMYTLSSRFNIPKTGVFHIATRPRLPRTLRAPK